MKFPAVTLLKNCFSLYFIIFSILVRKIVFIGIFPFYPESPFLMFDLCSAHYLHLCRFCFYYPSLICFPHSLSIRCPTLALSLSISLLSPFLSLPVRPQRLPSHPASLQTPIQALAASLSPLCPWLSSTPLHSAQTPLLGRY